MIKFTVVISLIQFAAYLASRGIESLSLRRNIRFGSLVAIFAGSYFYWNSGDALIQKPYASDIAFHMILPVMVVTVVAFAGTALLTRTTMMEVLKEDYILTARAKGISQKRIRDRHAARTALLPVVTSFIFTIVTIIDGSVLTEQIFSWPGMGQLLLQSVLEEDIPALIQKPYASDIAFHMILPVMVVTVVAFAGTALLTRTTMMEVLKEDYILTARAKGISQKRIRDRHAARTALLPVVTSFIFTIVTIIDGSVLTEQIFSWPGMGQLLLQSVLEEDIPVAMATFSFVGVFALIAHLLADVSYSYLDPRIRIKSQG